MLPSVATAAMVSKESDVKLIDQNPRTFQGSPGRTFSPGYSRFSRGLGNPGQGSWVNLTSAIFWFRGILWGWTVGRAPNSPPFDFYSTIELQCGLLKCELGM
jgi:hypothetical protein